MIIIMTKMTLYYGYYYDDVYADDDTFYDDDDDDNDVYNNDYFFMTTEMMIQRHAMESADAIVPVESTTSKLAHFLFLNNFLDETKDGDSARKIQTQTSILMEIKNKLLDVYCYLDNDKG